MKYFETLPKIVVTENKVSKVFTNLLARTNVIQGLINNPLLFYTYDIQESDTPEIIAHKYYDDIDRYWIVLLVNQIFDPQWNWPLTPTNFDKYVLSKYDGSLDNIHHYEKIVTKTNRSPLGSTTTVDTEIISEETYNDLPYNSDNTYTIGSEIVDVNIKTKIVTIREYELELNESKRNIKLLNVDYVQKIESELFNLMSR